MCLTVVSVLLKIRFGHAQISVSKIGIPISKTACIKPWKFQRYGEKPITLYTSYQYLLNFTTVTIYLLQVLTHYLLSGILKALTIKHHILTFVLILLSLPEQTSLDFTIKCVLPAIHVVYMGKIIELVFPTLVITFLLTFIFCSLSRQVSFAKYALNIFSHNEQCYYKKKHISSTFETLKMQTSLVICFITLNTKKYYYCSYTTTK